MLSFWKITGQVGNQELSTHSVGKAEIQVLQHQLMGSHKGSDYISPKRGKCVSWEAQ